MSITYDFYIKTQPALGGTSPHMWLLFSATAFHVAGVLRHADMDANIPHMWLWLLFSHTTSPWSQHPSHLVDILRASPEWQGPLYMAHMADILRYTHTHTWVTTYLTPGCYETLPAQGDNVPHTLLLFSLRQHCWQCASQETVILRHSQHWTTTYLTCWRYCRKQHYSQIQPGLGDSVPQWWLLLSETVILRDTILHRWLIFRHSQHWVAEALTVTVLLSHSTNWTTKFLTCDCSSPKQPLFLDITRPEWHCPL